MSISGDAYSFVVHSSSDLTYVVLVLGFLTLIEVPLVHLLVAKRSPLTAWIISGLSVYVLIWLVGLANSVRTFTPRNA